MRKRFLSLLCVLALCLGLLSVTALAAVPSEQAKRRLLDDRQRWNCHRIHRRRHTGGQLYPL